MQEYPKEELEEPYVTEYAEEQKILSALKEEFDKKKKVVKGTIDFAISISFLLKNSFKQQLITESFLRKNDLTITWKTEKSLFSTIFYVSIYGEKTIVENWYKNFISRVKEYNR